MRPCEVGGCGERYERHVIWRSGRGGGFTVAVSLRGDSVTLVLPLAPGKVIGIQKEGREKINLLTSNSGDFVGAPRPCELRVALIVPIFTVGRGFHSRIGIYS